MPLKKEDEKEDADSATRLAPIKGLGIPDLPHSHGVRFEPSEVTDITDLGNHMHQLKIRGQVLSISSSLSTGVIQEPLQDRLLEALHPTPGHEEHKGFFPLKSLEHLVNKDCVFAQLKEDLVDLPDNELWEYARTVCGLPPAVRSYKKIFVILVLCERT